MQTSRAKWIRLTEILSVFVFFVVFGFQVADWLNLLALSGGWAMVWIWGVLAYLAADFVSGFFHWFCDRFYEVNTPIIGPILIAPFREHHVDPRAMTRHDFFEMNGNNCMVLVPFIFLWNAVGEWGGFSSVGWQSFLIFFSVGIFGTNQFHAWAHCERVSSRVRWLQRAHMILSPQHHLLHHHGDHSKAFCVTNGWLNPVLDRLGFFRALERVFVAVGVPVQGSQMEHM